jgi:hypothetical protein
MRVLITCGSKRGGTEGIGRMLADTLQQNGHRVDLLPPDEAARATGFDAVIVGGALYANRWHRAAGFVQRSLALFGSILGLWLPLVLIFVATWATGELHSIVPQTGTPQTRAA